ncbi:MAG: helix-turn-helix domain-containing protein [Actinomycetes bacterium]
MGSDDQTLRERAVAMRREGRTRREIRQALGIGQSRLTRLLDGEPPHPSVRRPRAKDDLRDRARTLRGEGVSISQVARELGVPRGSVSRWTRQDDRADEAPAEIAEEVARLPPPTGDERRDRAVALRLSGRSRRAICEEVGVSRRLLDRWLVGVPVPEWTRRPRAKDEERARALDMRSQGLSYGAIAAEVGVSEATVSQWMRHVRVAIPEEERVQRLRQANAARARTITRRASGRRQQEKLNASRDIDSLSDRELFLLGVGLYWAEGSKDKSWLGAPPRERVTFVNSDAGMVQVFLAWLALLGYSRDELVFRVQIHESANTDAALAYWSEVVGPPAASFARTTLKRHNPATNRRNTGEAYRGCLCITVLRSSSLYRAIEGWWCGIAVAADTQWPAKGSVSWGPRTTPHLAAWTIRRVPVAEPLSVGKVVPQESG